MSDELLVRPADVGRFGADVLVAAGMAPDEARVVSESLVAASLRGVDSHGVTRIPVYSARVAAGGIVSPARFTLLSESGGVALFDAHHSAGQVSMTAAVGDAINRVATHGIAMTAVRNANHIGALGYYSEEIARHDMVGIVMCNASAQIAPVGGAERMIGNNPWSIAVPSDDGPVVMDIANSVVARGKLRLYERSGRKLPSGWARDEGGHSTDDPSAGLKGFLEPIAGHKGYAMAMMFDLICGVLTDSGSGPAVGQLLPEDQGMRVGAAVIAIGLSAFSPDESLVDKRVADYASAVRASRRVSPEVAIHVPGDIERATASHRGRAGLPLDTKLCAELRRTALSYGVSIPEWLSTDN